MAKHGSIDDGARRGDVEGARGSRRAASGPRSAGAEGARARGRHAVPQDADARAGSHAVDQDRDARRAERGAHATAEERVRDGRAGASAAQDARARRAVRGAEAARDARVGRDGQAARGAQDVQVARGSRAAAQPSSAASARAARRSGGASASAASAASPDRRDAMRTRQSNSAAFAQPAQERRAARAARAAAEPPQSGRSQRASRPDRAPADERASRASRAAAPVPTGRSAVQGAAPRAASQKTAPRAASSVVPAAATAGEYGRAADRYSTQSRKKGPWRVVFWVALVVFVLSLAALAAIGFSYWSGQRAYDDIASENFSAPSDVSGATLADFSVNWGALRTVNPDVVAWVYIPDTDVSYPIVHRDGDDSHYLTHDFNGNTRNVIGAEYGCVMLSGENAGDFSDAVNVIYGHNMANGSMFALLARFTDSATFNAHRTFYLLTPAGNYELTSFAVDRVPGSSTDIVIPNPGDVTAYVQARLDASTVTPDPAAPAASEIDKVFAFSTCDAPDNSYRIITFCSVTDYQPAGTGAGDTGAAQVDEGDIANVEGSVEGRVS